MRLPSTDGIRSLKAIEAIAAAVYGPIPGSFFKFGCCFRYGAAILCRDALGEAMSYGLCCSSPDLPML